MATLTWNSAYGFDLADIDLSNLLYAYSYSRSSTRFSANYNASGSRRDEFRGTGFNYDVNGTPIGGTVTSYAAYYYGTKTASITGASISATSIAAAAETLSGADDLRVFRTVLSGNDNITGGLGNDKLEGFNGKDMLYGRLGADKLYGGLGADAFTFKSTKDSTVFASGRDTIYDFSYTQGDRIDLRSIDANTKAAGNQAFSFIGKNAFHQKAGELRYEKYGSGVIVSGDVNGDGNADFSIHLKNLASVSKAYFML
ncbi:Ca2+-binding RTX toxin-like protein [Microvirga flocculans]|uniref:Ca2+-binding RTX toxin-like protein n=1 Tax=Microvirga flocculans TaxID=217168 RepID=A0A7W6IDI0_9HYPH|nr:hypothetical protein [Microvirga flocculans]MBB4039414.1 Ca2+-binding RTX toxin-like protein [Microvirga flocculans]